MDIGKFLPMSVVLPDTAGFAANGHSGHRKEPLYIYIYIYVYVLYVLITYINTLITLSFIYVH